MFASSACILLAGCSPAQSMSSASTPAPQPVETAPSDAPPVVRLTASQRDALKIEPVGSYAFSLEKQGVGNIDFDEDLPLVQAESALLAAAASYELSGKVLARARDLYAGNGGIPQKELEQAISDHQSAEAALKAARDAARALGRTDAEIDRVVTARKIEAANPSIKWLVANVAESDAPFVRVSQPVTVTVAAHPGRVFTGKVAKVYAIVDPVTHRSKVRCQIADPGNELRAGMLARFRIRVQEPVEATAVPTNTVVREGDGTMTAWVTSDRQRFEQKIVQPGLRQDDRIQVLAGLERGELVVTDGGVFLSNLLDAPPTD